MKIKYLGLEEINGPLVFIKTPKDVSFEEQVIITLKNGEKRIGNVLRLDEDITTIQVYKGTNEINIKDVQTEFMGEPLKIKLSPLMLGRVFDGAGKPIDGLGDIETNVSRDINSNPINPIARKYPRNYIHTGISTIDGLITLIRGQKIPIFSGSGLNHNELAERIIRQSNITDGGKFAIVFGLMGAEFETAEFFRKSFEENGVLSKVVMFQSLADAPSIERIMTPRCALTAAEYLAFKKGMHVLVVLTDMTNYCEALREISTTRGEVPGRKGYPGYLYSDLAELYERAGKINDSEGSITQIPILTMPNDDITHPVPDLTGYITEGQIVLDRNLDQTGIYPPVSVLPSLSRLMKDGIGEGYTREDHQMCANQLFAAYAKVQDARSLASVIGEEELTPIDKAYIKFGVLFEKHFINQGFDVNRTIDETLDLGWSLLSTLPKSELDRVDEEHLEKYYSAEKAKTMFGAENDN